MKLLITALSCLISVSVVGQNKKLDQLKAILILGEGDDKQEEILYFNKIADLLDLNGWEVIKCYDNITWEEVTLKGENANVLIYQGHGIYWKDDGYGGFDLKNNVSRSDVRLDLNLNPEALILFQSVCGGAGSSAGDNEDIGIAEAKKRIINFSEPFFFSGAGAYFAINTKNGVFDFLTEFLNGETIDSIFNNSLSVFYNKEINEIFKDDKVISIASSDWGGEFTRTHTEWNNGKKTTTIEVLPSFKKYNIAYISNPNFNILDLTLK